MKKFAVILFLLTSPLWPCSPDANTIAYWTLADGSTGTLDQTANGYNLLTNGTPTYATIDGFPCAGNNWNNFNFALPAALCTAIQGLDVYTIEAEFWDNSSPTSIWWSFGSLRIVDTVSAIGLYNATSCPTTAFPTAAWHSLAASFSGYATGNLYTDNTAHACPIESTIPNPLTSAIIGNYILGGLPFNGYIRNFRISSIARSSFPTTDVCTPSPVVSVTYSPTPGPSSTPSATPIGSVTPAPRNGFMPKPILMFNSPGGTGNYSDVSTRALADSLVSSGLTAYGWQTVHIDCGWAAGRDGFGNLTSVADFPNMPDLISYVHGKGLKFSIYTTDGNTDCGTGPGSYGHEIQDANTFASWGVDDVTEDDFGSVGGENIPRQLQIMYNATQTNSSGRPMTYQTWSVSQGSWSYGPASHFNSWWVAEVYPVDWTHVLIGLTQLYTYAGIAGLGIGWNNGGELWIGAGSPVSVYYPNPLSLNEQKVQYYTWCIEKSCLMLYDVNPSAMSADTTALVKNSEAIAVNQDPLGIPGTLVHDFGDGRFILSCPLDGGRKYAALLVNNTGAPVDIPIQWSYIGESGKAAVRNLDTRLDLGLYTTSYTAPLVPVHAAVFIKADFLYGKPSSIYLKDQLKLKCCE